MLKKTIKFEDYNGNQVEETHFFHLSKADLVELEMRHKGGLQAYIQRVVDSQDGRAIIEEFKNLISMSYGQKNDSGTRFVKNQELRDDFLGSPAYDELFMELVTNADKAAEFINGIVPANLEAEMAKMAKPARTVNEVVEAERIRANGDDTPVENVFDNNVPVPDDPSTLHNEGGPSRDPIGQQLDARLLTTKEVREMDPTQLQQGLATGAFRLS